MSDSHSEAKFTERKLKVSDIRLDPSLQPRLQIDQQAVREYADDMDRDGLHAFPTVTVFDDGDDLFLVDGFHRLIAAKSRRHETIHCRVYSGTKDEARWFACGCNRDHGLRRTTADKQRAVICALHCDPSRSNAEIARHVGVDDKTVGKYRRELIDASEIPESTHRRGADGRLVNTANIGKRSKRSVQKDAERHQKMGPTPADTEPEVAPLSAQPANVVPQVTGQMQPKAEAGLGEARLGEAGLGSGSWEQLRVWLQRRIQEHGRETVWSELRSLLQTLDFSVKTISDFSVKPISENDEENIDEENIDEENIDEANIDAAAIDEDSQPQAKDSSVSRRQDASVVQDWVSVEL